MKTSALLDSLNHDSLARILHCDALRCRADSTRTLLWYFMNTYTSTWGIFIDTQWTVHEHGSTLTSNTTTALQPFLRLHMSLSPSKTSKQLFVLLCSSRAHGDGSDPPPLCLSTVNEPPLLNTSIYPYIFEFLFTFITTVSVFFPLPVSLQIFQHFSVLISENAEYNISLVPTTLDDSKFRFGNDSDHIWLFQHCEVWT